MKQTLLGFFLLLSSCDVIEIVRAPILAPPLGLRTYMRTSGGQNQLAVRFQGNNREIYFSGYLIYVSTNRADLERVDTANKLFALKPENAQILTNFKDPVNTNVSITYNGAMSKAEEFVYPHNASISGENLLSSILVDYDGGTAFVTGTNYYIGVYAYSRADAKLSIPSIASFKFL